jgi:hypothetical protein
MGGREPRHRGGGLVDQVPVGRPPPNLNPECRGDGQWIICRTTVVTELVSEPVFDLSCGTIYETSRDLRLGIRWYAAPDSVIVKRNVRQEFSGTWSLSPDGSTPSVRLLSRANWQDSQYADPTDLDSGVRYLEGNFTVHAPGGGLIAILAGLDEPDGTHHGAVRSLDDPAIVAKVCAALGG